VSRSLCKSEILLTNLLCVKNPALPATTMVRTGEETFISFKLPGEVTEELVADNGHNLD